MFKCKINYTIKLSFYKSTVPGACLPVVCFMLISMYVYKASLYGKEKQQAMTTSPLAFSHLFSTSCVPCHCYLAREIIRHNISLGWIVITSFE